MKYEIHVPVEKYGFISATFESRPGYVGNGWEVEGYEPTEEEVVEAYKSLQRAWKYSAGGEGIGLKALAQVLHEYCTTGGIVNGGEYDFSEKENALIAEVKKLIRTKNK